MWEGFGRAHQGSGGSSRTTAPCSTGPVGRIHVVTVLAKAPSPLVLIRPRRCRAALAWLTAALILLPGCGGSSSQTKSADAADDDYESSGSGGEASSECEDGTCFGCGSGICPTGHYCDESSPGGAACGWLPECAQEATCSCVEAVFTDCSCEERAGGVYLSCE